MLGIDPIASTPISSPGQTSSSSLSLAITTGSYTLTNNSINFLLGKTLSISSRSYSLTTFPINFNYNHVISLVTRTYTLTNNNINLITSLPSTLSLTSSPFTLSLNSINFAKTNLLQLETTPFTFTESPLSYVWVHSIPLSSAGIILNTPDVTLSLGSAILPKLFNTISIAVVVNTSDTYFIK